MDTVELIRSIDGYDALTVNTFTPYHGTVLRDVAVRNGWLSPDIIPNHTTSQSSLIMPPPYLNSEEIEGLMKVMPLYCYFPKDTWGELRRAETGDEIGNRIRGRYAEIYRQILCG